jgi:hypothetical protein
MYCPASVRREESNDKGQRVLPLIGGLSVMAFCSSPPWLANPIAPRLAVSSVHQASGANP